MAILSTRTSDKAWSMDVLEFPAEEAIPTALALRITTVAAEIEGDATTIRVPVVADDAAAIVAEGSVIPEAAPELSEAVLTTVKVAKLIRLSREQFAQHRTPEVLADAAQRSIIAKADAVLLNQPAPTPPEVHPGPGLLAQGLNDAGTVGDDLDALVDALATLRANGSNPSHFVLSPSVWGTLQKMKTGTGSAMNLLGAGTQDTVPLLLGTPVLVNSAVPSGTGLIVDKRDIVSAVGAVHVAASEEAFFSSDSVGVRVTFRFGARLVHPDRHAKFLAGPQPEPETEPETEPE